MPSDLVLILRTLPRIYAACRTRGLTAGSKAAGASERQGQILEQLDLVDPVMMTELAEAMGVTPATMSVNVGRMVAAGLVTRDRDPDDRRVQNVRLTQKGVDVRNARAELDVARVDGMLRLLSEDARALVRGALLSLSEAAEAVDPRS